MFDRPTYVDAIMKFADAPLIKVLTGIRRCGKSTILLMLIEALKKRGIPSERILNYRFDSMKYDGLTAKALYEMLLSSTTQGQKSYIFLDEIQEIQGWEKVVNSLMQEADVDIYVTGSNSRMMSSEISTYLTGRYISFEIFPLSFAEYLTFRKSYTDIGHPRTELDRYIQIAVSFFGVVSGFVSVVGFGWSGAAFVGNSDSMDVVWVSTAMRVSAMSCIRRSTG